MNNQTVREEKQKEFAEIIENKSFTGICIIAPRFGKTKTVLDSLKNNSEWNVYVSVPRDTIIKSWEEDIIKWESDLKPKLLCSRSLSKVSDKTIDLLIIDECQTLSENEISYIRIIKPRRLLLLTGTLKKSKEINLQQLLRLKTIINYPIDKAIQDSIISDYEINIVRTNLTMDEKKQYTNLTNKFNYLRDMNANYVVKMNSARRRMQFIYNCQSKIDEVKNFITKLVPNERFILFSADTKVSKKLSDNTFDSKSKNTSNLDKFVSQEINNLGTVRMVDMGMTFPNLKLGIIHQIQSNEEIFLQRALRCCNLDNDGRVAKIYIFVCKDTVDETWLESCLKDINKEKIKYLN